MQPGEIVINGVSLSDSNIWVQSRPIISGPQRRIEFVQSFQQDGSLPFDDEAYENTELELSLASIPPESLAPSNNDIATVDEMRQKIYNLMDGGDYQKYRFYFDPDKYYYAMVTEFQSESKRFLNSASAMSVTLTVLPWKYLVSNKQHEISSGVKIKNPTGKIARPIIKITGTGDCLINIGGRSFSLKGLTGSIVIDSDVESAYTVTTNGTIASNQNDKVYTREFPYLNEGTTEITWTGDSITKVEIEERWRTLI